MPICPGCERKIAYSRLDVHERYCDGIRRSDDVRRRAEEQFERRLSELEERIEDRRDGEIERRLVAVERDAERPKRSE